MFNFYKTYLAICFFTSFTSQIQGAKEYTIDLSDYNEIKSAVFAKKGPAYASLFDELYPTPSDSSVIALSKEFDADSLGIWFESYPPQSFAYINGKKFHINGEIAIILYPDYRFNLKCPYYSDLK
jgi:hypothetical protein